MKNYSHHKVNIISKKDLYNNMSTVLQDTLGSAPIIKVIDCLIIHSEWEYNLKQISALSGVSYTKIKALIPKLVKSGIVNISGKKGKAILYKLNQNNSAVKHLVRFDMELSAQAWRRDLATVQTVCIPQVLTLEHQQK